MGLWSVNAAVLFMIGYLLIGVGFLLFYLDAMRAIIATYGSLGRALGLQWLFGGEIDKAQPVAVVASTMVAITNSIGILAGAVVLDMCIVNANVPSTIAGTIPAAQPNIDRTTSAAGIDQRIPERSRFISAPYAVTTNTGSPAAYETTCPITSIQCGITKSMSR
jgi:hypothetical protein